MIGERLIDLRKDAGLTQDELAKILNINKHSISSYEREKSEPPDSIKIAIAEYFNVSVDYLLGINKNPAPYTPNNQCCRLPHGFPPEALPALLDYAEFLTLKYGKDNY